jgi:hypothetical protein
VCRYLDAHPDVFLSKPKEPIFFEAEYERGLDYYWRRYYSDWSGEGAAGEGRTFHLFLPFVPSRIRESLPDAKLIAILRDPVTRAYSHWWHRFTRRAELLTFEDAIEQNLERIAAGIDFQGKRGAEMWRQGLINRGAGTRYATYVDCGLYADQLERYLQLFPREQIRVLLYDDLITKPGSLVHNLWDFLGLPLDARPGELPPQNVARTRMDGRLVLNLQRRFSGGRLARLIPGHIKGTLKCSLQGRKVAQPKMAPETRRRLREYYREPNQRLETLLARDLSAWRGE